jgi:signal transduction histidine kinase
MDEHINMLQELKQQNHTLESEIRNLKHFIEDSCHDLKGILNHLHFMARAALKYAEPNSELETCLFYIRAASARVNDRIKVIGLVPDLLHGKPIKPSLSHLRQDDLIKMVITLALDAEHLFSRDIRYTVDRESFEQIDRNEVLVDEVLLKIAIWEILENAQKYSYSNTIVRIYSGLTRTGRFHITFTNRGMPIDASEVAQCLEIGWRGEEAKTVTGGGLGVGLWIVDNIMNAHGGNLIIQPTTSDRLTEIKLIFPTLKFSTKSHEDIDS